MEDKKQVDGIRLLKWNKGFPLEFYDESVRIAYKSENAPYIKGKIKEKIERCSGTVCFLGQTTWQSPWVNGEIETSLACGNELLLMGLPNGPQRLNIPSAAGDRGWMLWSLDLLTEFANK
jgi:hypothetical protein